MWERAEKVAQGRATKKEKELVDKQLDSLFDITTCQHEILLCKDKNSGCKEKESCQMKAHIQCDCPMACKLPKMELRWLYGQRNKINEKSDMMMSSEDKDETEHQNKAESRKMQEEEAEKKRKMKEKEEEEKMMALQEQAT